MKRLNEEHEHTGDCDPDNRYKLYECVCGAWDQDKYAEGWNDCLDALIASWPTMTRDMVSRGQVLDWLKSDD